jgi:hypothetical protein
LVDVLDGYFGPIGGADQGAGQEFPVGSDPEPAPTAYFFPLLFAHLERHDGPRFFALAPAYAVTLMRNRARKDCAMLRCR